MEEMSEQIQELMNSSIRNDERVKSILENHNDLEKRVNNIAEMTSVIKDNIHVMKSLNVKVEVAELKNVITELHREIIVLDKRLTSNERILEGAENRWSSIVKFVVQMIWLIVGTWILFKLGLSSISVQ